MKLSKEPLKMAVMMKERINLQLEPCNKKINSNKRLRTNQRKIKR